MTPSIPDSTLLTRFINFAYKADEVLPASQALIDSARLFFDSLLLSVNSGAASPAEAVAKWAEWEGPFTGQCESLTFLQHVSEEEAIRAASADASKLFSDFAIEIGARKDLYQGILKACTSQAAFSLGGFELARFWKKTERDFRIGGGMDLTEEKRDALKEKRAKLARLSIDFSVAIAEDATELLVTEADLDGCPADFIASLERKPDPSNESVSLLAVTMKYPHIAAVQKYAKNREIRKRLEETNSKRCAENVTRLAEAVSLRTECAALLGYESHAHLQLEDRLAKDPASVRVFLMDLKERLQPLATKELEKLRELASIPEGDHVATFDYHFWSRVLMEREYAVDQQRIKEYFPVEHVIREMLAIYAELLGLQFVPEESIPNPAQFHPDAKLFRVISNTGNDSSVAAPKTIGYFYLDLHPRKGKYTHAACFTLRPGFTTNNGSERVVPLVAVLANFTAPSEDRPSLLLHDEVVTLFHEFGHAMHAICSRVNLARFHGTATETDFVEAPSQMLENWCWEGSVLKRLSCHYKKENFKEAPCRREFLNENSCLSSLPDELLTSLQRSRNVNAGLLNLRQIFFALFDLNLHDGSFQTLLTSADALNRLYDEMRREVTRLAPPEGVFPVATFGHLLGGYDAGYYGYLYSLVFAADMYWTRFHPLVPSHCKENEEAEFGEERVRLAGESYRREILVPGASRDGSESLRAFLGREPRNDAFLRALGLQSK